jgi:hypothetical protein
MYQHVLKLKGAMSGGKSVDMNRTWVHLASEQNLAHLDVFRQFSGMLMEREEKPWLLFVPLATKITKSRMKK